MRGQARAAVVGPKRQISKSQAQWRRGQKAAGGIVDRIQKTEEDLMKFSEFVVRDAIVAELKSTDRDGVLRELVGALSESGALPEGAVDGVVEALLKREKNGSTGVGQRVAVPHVKHPRIKKMAATIGRSVGGVEFAALDHQPVYSV